MSDVGSATDGNNTTVLNQLGKIADIFERAWLQDLVLLRASQVNYDTLREALADYDGSHFISTWYRDHLLAGCRRLVDRGDDVVSMREALLRLRRIAGDLTPEVIARHRMTRENSRSFQEELSEVRNWLERGTNEDGENPLLMREVQSDLDRIRDVGDRVHDLATHQLAHRLEGELPATVTYGEIYGLLETLGKIHARWSVLLRATDVDQRIGHLDRMRSVSNALRLFDPEEYVEAIGTEQRSREYSVTFSELEERARLEYRFAD